MSDQRARACPNCRKLIDERETRCPHCGTNVSIITVPLEPLPPDDGAASEDAEEALAAIEPEILPPDDVRSGECRNGLTYEAPRRPKTDECGIAPGCLIYVTRGMPRAARAGALP